MRATVPDMKLPVCYLWPVIFCYDLPGGSLGATTSADYKNAGRRSANWHLIGELELTGDHHLMTRIWWWCAYPTSDLGTPAVAFSEQLRPQWNPSIAADGLPEWNLRASFPK
jgi:hypothetical protein